MLGKGRQKAFLMLICQISIIKIKPEAHEHNYLAGI